MKKDHVNIENSEKQSRFFFLKVNAIHFRSKYMIIKKKKSTYWKRDIMVKCVHLINV